MPTAPLFYQPLVMARVQTTQVGKANVIDSFNQQQKLIGEAYQNPKFRPAIDGIVTGFTKLQEQLPNSRTLETPQFAFDDEGYVANRVMTTMRLHPNLFDTASPDQAAEIGAKLVEEAKKELGEDRIMRAAGDTLEFTPRATLMLKHAWEGNELDSDSVAELGINAARELQRSVTPLEPDATHPTLQWIEDATANALGMWDGVAAETASALGLKADPAKVAKSVEAYRSWFATKNPQAASHISSLGALLGSAGISGSDDKAAAAAFQVLQGGPLDGVPASIAQGIVGYNTLPPDAKDYIAGRIVETTGSSGNVKGLLAEIELMKRPVPVDPPGGGTPPPDGGTPPPGGGEPVPPPGGETPPPVDPPKDGDTTPARRALPPRGSSCRPRSRRGRPLRRAMRRRPPRAGSRPADRARRRPAARAAARACAATPPRRSARSRARGRAPHRTRRW